MLPLTQPHLSIRASWSEIARACGAHYICPRDALGHCLGPLAAYSARDEQDRQLVGYEYLDFAKIEQWPGIVKRLIVPHLIDGVERLGRRALVWIGMPEGGKALANILALTAGQRFIYPEKVTIAPATATSKAKTASRFTGRHDIQPGDQIAVVEDVCNNFSTTEDALVEIDRLGGRVVVIVCFLNRSPIYRDVYESPRFGSIPIVCCWDHEMAEFRQDDPAVAHQVAVGNVEWKPKDNWPRMLEAMRQPA